MYVYIMFTFIESVKPVFSLIVLTVMFSPDDYGVSEGEVATVTLVTNLAYTFDFSVTVVCESGSASSMYISVYKQQLLLMYALFLFCNTPIICRS